MSEVGGIDSTRLLSLIERIEHLEEENLLYHRILMIFTQKLKVLDLILKSCVKLLNFAK